MSQTVQLRETSTVGEAAAAAAKTSGRMLIQLINPGWGSSGYYGADVLEAAGQARVFPAGTHMYLDHPTAAEEDARPERSVKDLAAVLTTDAVWNGDALVGEATVFGPYRDVIAEMKDAIGVSIRGSARVSEGTAEGRKGRIIEELVQGASVDFVTRAGRGGKVLEVLESARAEVVEKAVANGVAEATANDTRDRLETVLKDTYGGEKSWTWVRDFDGTHVWYSLETPDSSDLFQHEYAVGDNGDVTLSGKPVEVRQETTFVPTTRSDSTTTTESQKENLMGKIEIDESEHQRLVGIAGRVEALEAERDTEKARADQAEKDLAEAKKTSTPRTPREVMEARDHDLRTQVATLHARERARDIIGEELAEAWLPPTTVARLSTELLADLPLVGESLALDEQGLRDRVVQRRDQHELEAAEALQAAGVGIPRGLSAQRSTSTDTTNLDESTADSLGSAFGLTEAEAAIAAKGR